MCLLLLPGYGKAGDRSAKETCLLLYKYSTLSTYERVGVQGIAYGIMNNSFLLCLDSVNVNQTSYP